MKDKKKFLIASGIGLAAGAALAAYLKKRKNAPEMLPYEYEDEMYLDFSSKAVISYEDAEKKARESAQDKLGSDAKVVSASDCKTLTINIEGTPHHCFLFGAVSDNLSVNSETLLLYVDAMTGEVFESDKIN